MARERLDKVLVDRGLAPSRERARALILAGKVLVDGQPVTKAGHPLDPAAEVALREADHPYVSRGALKLIKGLDAFGVDVAGAVALDIGASTGGFTDVLLRRGARRVYAIDVGYGQLAWSLRQDPRVVVLERQNVREMDLALVPEPADLAVIDVSFISLTLVLPRIVELLRPAGAAAGTTAALAGATAATAAAATELAGATAATATAATATATELAGATAATAPAATELAGATAATATTVPALPATTTTATATTAATTTAATATAATATTTAPAPARLGKPIIALVKPQFEAGREHVGKGGVVRDPAARLLAVEKVRSWATAHGLVAGDFVESPITGPAGNVEYLLILHTIAAPAATAAAAPLPSAPIS
jgi:23S rRNA (cytidine1920-2'-O)/16S rRNA (cytidine1409-2'-O)-methyltransferase